MQQPATYYHVKGCASKIQVHQGGTRSGKTYSILTVIIELCHRSHNAGAVITIARKTFPAVRASVMRDFFNILAKEDAYDPGMHNKSEATYMLWGNLVEFISVDQPQKVKGRKRDLLFLNEANELALEDWRQLALRTTGMPNGPSIILDYNPSDEFHWIYDEVIPRADAEFFQTTYKDNPFLEQSVVDEIERLQDTDENYWRVYGLGERGSSPSVIFPQWQAVDHPAEGAKLVAHGLDWGYANDPTALISVYRRGHELFFQEQLYSTSLTNPDISEELDRLGIGRELIIADSAEPKSLEELHRLGWNIKPSRKGPDSVRQGIDIMKRHRLHIVGDSPNLTKELRNYKWQTDKNGRNINRPVDTFNHAVDAIRYVCLNKLTTSHSGKYYIS